MQDFIGHHLVKYILINTDWEVVILDKLSYATRGLDRLREINVFQNPRVKMLTHDLANKMSVGVAREIGYPDVVYHLAAESHVDNSVVEPLEFVRSNVLGTANLLQFFKDRGGLRKFIYFSTDEVFGPTDRFDEEEFKADDRHMPKNPYAATKAAAEDLAVAWQHTYKMPIQILHCMNVFSTRQHPEKFIPLAIKKIVAGDTVQIYTDDSDRIGARFYISAEDVARLLVELIQDPQKGWHKLKLNIAGIAEVTNLKMAEFIAETLGKKLHHELVAFDLGKSSHDLRYALDGDMFAIWTTEEQMFEQLKETILWTRDHPEWLEWS